MLQKAGRGRNKGSFLSESNSAGLQKEAGEMSKGFSFLFNGTLGSSFLNDPSREESYTDRGIEVPEHIQKALSKLKKKGDILISSPDSFGMMDVSIMSKETGVEFAKVTIGNKSYLIRGDGRGTGIPDSLLDKMKTSGGTLDFHSHPRSDDLVPSRSDMEVMKVLTRTTGQKTSTIVTPNGRTSTFNERGVVELGTVPNTIDKTRKEMLKKLFGGK